MSYIQVSCDIVDKIDEKIELNIPRSYNANFIFFKLLYLNKIEDPDFPKSIIDAINNWRYLEKFSLASSDIGLSTQEGINLVVTDNKLNDATVRRVLYSVYKNIFKKIKSPWIMYLKTLLKMTLNGLLFETQEIKLKVGN